MHLLSHLFKSNLIFLNISDQNCRQNSRCLSHTLDNDTHILSLYWKSPVCLDCLHCPFTKIETLSKKAIWLAWHDLLLVNLHYTYSHFTVTDLSLIRLVKNTWYFYWFFMYKFIHSVLQKKDSLVPHTSVCWDWFCFDAPEDEVIRPGLIRSIRPLQLMCFTLNLRRKSE